MENGEHTDELEKWIKRFQEGDEQARSWLIEYACERFRLVARKMFRSFPKVRRWEETDDVLVEALTRLNRSLETVQIKSSRHFRNLVRKKIGQVLLDMKRHYYGPLGIGANHDTAKIDSDGNRQANPEVIDRSTEPQSLEEWIELYEKIEALPDQEREVFDLLYFKDLTQQQAAKELGVGERTVHRRWQNARLLLQKAIGEKPPTD